MPKSLCGNRDKGLSTADGRRRAPIALLFGLTLLATGLSEAAPAGARSLKGILVDADTGVVLLSANADRPHPPASLSKMMTLYLVFDGLADRRFSLDTKWRVSRRAILQPASKLYLSLDERISVRDVISAIVVRSANDAAVVAAEAIAGSERRFAWLMTATARRLGMTRSRFRNATGLDLPGQMTTARDMARLARALLQHHPEKFAYFRQADMRYRGRYYRTANKFLRGHWAIEGMKIGYTTRSGYSFVATARMGGRHLISVALGEPTANARYSRAARLFRVGFARSRGNQGRYARQNGTLTSIREFSALDILDRYGIRVATAAD